MSEASGSPPPGLFMTELAVGDWRAAVAWYVEVLGLKPVFRDDAGRFALLAAGPARLALKQADAATAGGGGVRLVFLVADVDAERARLEAQGVAVGEAADHPREPYREVRLTGPEGVPITLFHWTARGPIHPAGS